MGPPCDAPEDGLSSRMERCGEDWRGYEVRRERVKKYLARYSLILLGSVIYAVGFTYFAYPNDIVPGGLTGVAMILNLLLKWRIGTLVIVLNIPLFLWAWKRLGLEFIVSSLIGMVISSLLLDLCSLFPAAATTEPLLGSVFAGLIKGFGLGLVYSTGATTGGIDIVAKFLRRRYPYINFGTLILALDVVVILAFALIFRKYDSAMVAMITMYIFAKVVDVVLYGPVGGRLCYIISEKSEAVTKAITAELRRGVTLLSGVGAYSGKEKQVLLCVVKRQQIVEVRKIVREIDVDAFLIVSDARDVYGRGFENITIAE